MNLGLMLVTAYLYLCQSRRHGNADEFYESGYNYVFLSERWNRTWINNRYNRNVNFGIKEGEALG